jgi:hypothetical protein
MLLKTQRNCRSLFKYLVCCAIVYLIVHTGFHLSTGDRFRVIETKAIDMPNPSIDDMLGMFGADAVSEDSVQTDLRAQLVNGNDMQPAAANFEREFTNSREVTHVDIERNKRLAQAAGEENNTDVDGLLQPARDHESVTVRYDDSPTTSTYFYARDGATEHAKDALQAAIAEIQPLIDQGLVVPRWNGLEEVPVEPGGPGIAICKEI